MKTDEKTVASELVRVEMGTHHEAFIAWCDAQGRKPSSVIKELVSNALTNTLPIPPALFKKPEKRQLLRVTLGELHKPFMKWCEEKKIASGTVLREWVLALMTGQDKKEPPSLKTSQVLGLVDNTRVRVVIGLTQSEFSIWEKLAEQKQESPAQCIKRVLRSYLTKGAGFTQEEAALLGTHNLLLLRSCNNINQLAKYANSQYARGEPVTVDGSALEQEIAALKSHVAHVSSLLTQNQERWLLKIDN
jgi:Bacterial mobilisation protein (MobC)